MKKTFGNLTKQIFFPLQYQSQTFITSFSSAETEIKIFQKSKDPNKGFIFNRRNYILNEVTFQKFRIQEYFKNHT